MQSLAEERTGWCLSFKREGLDIPGRDDECISKLGFTYVWHSLWSRMSYLLRGFHR